MSASRLIFSHIAEASVSVVEAVARNAWSQIRDIDRYWETLPEDIAIDATKFLSVDEITLGPPFHLDTPNPEATAEQYEAQRMVDDSSYEQWTQPSQLPLPEFGDLVQRERLGWDCDLGELCFTTVAPQTSGT
ncbi:hypothetical protein KC338_g9390 [Hortaea werneckii]|nr:hypothetical protein KC323_g9374 [Hortaea werneckii]KAI6854000.1 hypothetical protein KC338_g9390 [Hortaea werneckii]KAI7056537.1 hypothetical protein KC339_g18161 [Hortaea werneckii]KAI7203259.1 hypothetical protein KC365_g18285 [Hortaea werneckii]